MAEKFHTASNEYANLFKIYRLLQRSIKNLFIIFLNEFFFIDFGDGWIFKVILFIE